MTQFFAGTSFQSKQNAWFHFSVSGVPKGNTLRIQVANASNHSSLYRQDMVKIQYAELIILH